MTSTLGAGGGTPNCRCSKRGGMNVLCTSNKSEMQPHGHARTRPLRCHSLARPHKKVR